MSKLNHKAQRYSAKRRAELMEAYLEALKGTLGVVTPAADKIGVPRSTIIRWRDKYPEFDEACKEIMEIAVDFVESRLYKQIKDGSEACTIFYLKTKGKHRGYVEKQQIDMSAEVKGVTINVTNPETAQVLQDIMDKDNQ